MALVGFIDLLDVGYRHSTASLGFFPRVDCLWKKTIYGDSYKILVSKDADDR